MAKIWSTCSLTSLFSPLSLPLFPLPKVFFTKLRLNPHFLTPKNSSPSFPTSLTPPSPPPPCICGYSSASMCIQSLKPHVPFVLENTRAYRAQSPRVPQRHTELWNPPGTQVSTRIGHSGPHDLWGHRPNISPCLPLLILFFYNPIEGRGCLAFFRFLSPRGAQSSSSLFQLKSTSCSLQLISLRRPPRNPSSTISEPRRDVLQENFNQQLSCKAQQNQEGTSHTTSKTISQNCELHSKLFFPFTRTGNKTGLINTYTRRSKTVCSIMCDVYKFDRWCCDILVLSYLKVMLVCMLFTVFRCI